MLELFWGEGEGSCLALGSLAQGCKLQFASHFALCMNLKGSQTKGASRGKDNCFLLWHNSGIQVKDKRQVG
jgi:hypothetical protein